MIIILVHPHTCTPTHKHVNTSGSVVPVFIFFGYICSTYFRHFRCKSFTVFILFFWCLYLVIGETLLAYARSVPCLALRWCHFIGLSVCMWMCVRVLLYLCVHVCVRMSVYVCMCMCECVYVCASVCAADVRKVHGDVILLINKPKLL
jgi:hypothetical protein